jgi:uncharacterized protein
MGSRSPCFLTADWRDMAVLSWRVDPEVVRPLIPSGLAVDIRDGVTYVSLVGFMFLRTRALGVLPSFLCPAFAEVNLRCYARLDSDEGTGRGLVFLKELVPHWHVALAARLIQNKGYRALPVRRRLLQAGHLEYAWGAGGAGGSVRLRPQGEPAEPEAGSEIEYLAQHYGGFGKRRDGRTVWYAVEHAPWRVRAGAEATAEIWARSLLGDPFADILSRQPDSALLVEGSPVLIRKGVPL